MSWGYNSYRSKFYFSEREIDFSNEELDYNHFLLQEFFSADQETRENITKYYIEVYGERAYEYLQRQYPRWANREYHLTEQMNKRILAFMPRFLNEKAKYKLGIHEFMSTIKKLIKSFQLSQSVRFRNVTKINQLKEIVPFFENEFDKIETLTVRNFKFNVLEDSDKWELIEISKYILKIMLQEAIDKIERDLKIFLPYILKFNRGVFTASYSITLFNLKVDLTNTGFDDLNIPRFKIKELEAKSRFREYSDKYLAYELVSIHNKTKLAKSNSFLNENDLALFFAHYEELSNGEGEVRINTTFQGEGGVLSFKAQLRPLKLLKTTVVISSLKLTIYFIVITVLITLAIRNNLFALLIFGGFFIGIIAWGILGGEIQHFKTLIKEYKAYGKQ